ncbi:MAG TPA: hypothetical protein VMX57_05280 [Planctomycetota bacterium]|nr:hypothetical protein [Planctomycetota bacterium]
MTDPADAETRDDVACDPEEIPCCTGCGRPYVKGQYYCQHCGTAVGNLTPYVPYVNIPFNYGPFTDLWKTLRGEAGAGIPRRILAAFVIILMSPIMIIGLPIVFIEWLRNRKKPDDTANEGPT